MSEPLLRSYVSDSHPPATVYPTLPGRWVGEPAWPTPHVRPVPYGFQGAPVLVRSPMHTASTPAAFFRSATTPTCRRTSGRRTRGRRASSSKWARGPGCCGGRECGCDRLGGAAGQVVARLCDVAPDGSSTLVTRGAPNLTARHGRDHVVPCEPGTTEGVTFEPNGIGHAFPSGHRIRLTVSSACRRSRSA